MAGGSSVTCADDRPARGPLITEGVQRNVLLTMCFAYGSSGVFSGLLLGIGWEFFLGDGYCWDWVGFFC